MIAFSACYTFMLDFIEYFNIFMFLVYSWEPNEKGLQKKRNQDYWKSIIKKHNQKKLF